LTVGQTEPGHRWAIIETSSDAATGSSLFDGGLEPRILSSGEETLRRYGSSTKHPPELLDRGARVVIESGRPIAHVARDLGVPAETLRRYVRQLEANEGLRPELPTSAEREEIRALRKEVYELRRANEILKAASVFF
jgi:transposase